MTCSDVERVLPELLDGAPDGAFQTAFETHVKSCPACSDLVSDLKLIASAARELAANDEPAPRVWGRIAAQLRAEGLIVDASVVDPSSVDPAAQVPAIYVPAIMHPVSREPESVPTRRPVLVASPSSPSSVRRWTATTWWLAPVAAALMAAGSYVVSHKPAPQLAKQTPAPSVTTSVAEHPTENSAMNSAKNSTKTPAVIAGSAPATAVQPVGQQPVKPTDTVASAAKAAVEPEPSAEDQQFLSVVSTRAPSLRATYENQLQAVNADIRDVQNYLSRNPGDADARQHLMDAYQQKALLYQIALDRIQ
jgi:hypothetical protein